MKLEVLYLSGQMRMIGDQSAWRAPSREDPFGAVSGYSENLHKRSFRSSVHYLGFPSFRTVFPHAPRIISSTTIGIRNLA